MACNYFYRPALYPRLFFWHHIQCKLVGRQQTTGSGNVHIHRNHREVVNCIKSTRCSPSHTEFKRCLSLHPGVEVEDRCVIISTSRAVHWQKYGLCAPPLTPCPLWLWHNDHFLLAHAICLLWWLIFCLYPWCHLLFPVPVTSAEDKIIPLVCADIKYSGMRMFKALIIKKSF